MPEAERQELARIYENRGVEPETALVAVAVAPAGLLVRAVAAVSLVCLAVLGILGARAGRAPIGRSVLRVVLWGALAMTVTAGVGRLFGTAVG